VGPKPWMASGGLFYASVRPHFARKIIKPAHKGASHMEDILKSLLHLGVDIAKTVEDGFQVNSTDPEGILLELINKGETADDQSIDQIRTYIENVTNLANEYELKAKEIFQSLTSSLQNLDVNNLVADLQQKFDDILAQVTGGGTSKTQDT